MNIKSSQNLNLTRQGNHIYFSSENPQLWFEKKDITEPTTLHIHDYYEIELITEGTGEYYHNGTAYPIGSGLLFFMTPTDFHQIVPIESCHILTVMIHESMISPEWQTFFMSQLNNAVYLLDTKERVQWTSRFTVIEPEIKSPDLYSAENQRRLMEVFLSAVARLAKKKGEQAGRHTNFQKALDYISHHYCENLSLEDFAAAVGYTPQYFCALFRKHTDRSLMDFITDLRLHHAKMLLRTTDLSATEICFRCGFNSQSSFFRQFRQRIGKTPAEYRKISTLL